MPVTQPPLVRPLEEQDILEAQLSCESREFILGLHKALMGKHLFLAECPYGTLIWKARALALNDEQLRDLTKPIGLVFHNVLEVTEEFTFEGVLRKRTTALIKPSEFFGLFEALAELSGDWEITAGVKRLIITKPLGNSLKLRKKGLNIGTKDSYRDIAHSLAHRREANYDYEDMLHHLKEDEWRMRVVLFDADRVQDARDRLFLANFAIRQLSSLVKQNPPDPFVAADSNESEKKQFARRSLKKVSTFAAVDAMLDGNLPVFRLATSEDEVALPISRLKSKLTHWTDGIFKNEATPIWVPAYYDSTSAGCLYISRLGGRLSLDDLDTYVGDMASQSGYRSNTRSFVRLLEGNYDSNYKLSWQSERGTQAYVYRFRKNAPKKEEGASNNIVDLPQCMRNAISSAHPFQQLGGGWPSSIADCLWFSPEPIVSQ